MEDLYWDEDGFDGRLSSMEVLLQWLSVAGNAKRWQDSTNSPDESRVVLVNEIYEFLLVHGITHRSHRNVDAKIWELSRSFEKVGHWLQRKGLCCVEPKSREERKVLKACLYYHELAHLLKSPHAAETTSPQVHHEDEVSIRTVEPFEYPGNDDADFVDVGVSGDKREKHIEVGIGYTEVGNAERLSLLEAERDVRRELLKLELQTKRDEAICVRVRARNELLELGVAVEEVERLMPL